MKLLGLRFAFLDEGGSKRVANGNALPASDVELCERRHASARAELCACTAGVIASCEAPRDGEIVSVIADNRLVALYQFDAGRNAFKSRCVFQTGVRRGADIEA